MIDDLLTQLGFDAKEIAVYTTILQKGVATPAEISDATSIKRTTVYSTAKELLKRRIISEDLGTPVRKLVAKPPEELQQLIAREQEKLDKHKDVVQQAIGELQKIAKTSAFVVPKISYIPEEEIDGFLRKRTSVWSASIMARDGVWWGFQDPTLVTSYEEWIHWSWTQMPEKLEVHLLSNQSDVERQMKRAKYPRRTIKFWKKGVDYSASMWICGDYVISVITNQHPHYLIETHDAVLAHNMREVCKGIWKSLK